jgi:hypothetical protein
LARSFFIGAFSIYDAFIGDLIVAVMSLRPELMDALSGAINAIDVLRAKSLDDLRRSILDREVESLRRESYQDQFKKLEGRFGLKLTAFKNWPSFVEAGQRRNIVTHCDGKVTDQYIRSCVEHGVALDPKARLGETLDISPEYLRGAYLVLRETAAKLTHTLWRKVFPDDRASADKALNELLFEALNLEEWDWAVTMGEFALSQPKFSDELYERMMLINYAQAWYHQGKKEEAIKIVGAKDWSASSADFRLAVAVLKDDVGTAVDLMKTIGRNDNVIERLSYHSWPLFRDLRTTSEFLVAYHDIYGESFVQELRDKARKDAAAASVSEGGADSESGDSPEQASTPTPTIALTAESSIELMKKQSGEEASQVAQVSQQPLPDV